jgi:Leucine-rich repeat (LRR) protein
MKSPLRRSLFLFCLFTLIMSLTAGNVAAAQAREGELILEVAFEKTDLVFSEHEDYDVVALARHGSTGEIGKPSLPQASFLVVIPPGARVKRIEIISSESEVLPGTYKIMPAQPPRPISSVKSSVILNSIDYHAVTPYPGKLVQHAHMGNRGGYQVAGIFIYPLQYLPSEKTLRFYSSVKFKVVYLESTRPVTAKTPAQVEAFGDIVEKTVINPEDVGRWVPPVKSASESNHDYFIITSSEFVDEFQPLVDWKNRKGVRTEITTIEDIISNYSGSDLQEKIKNFIIDMEVTYGAIYFLLGGDTNVVPHKLLTTGYSLDGEPIPSDLYYSDLNDDLFSDVFVGRAPAENEDEVTTFVNKVLTYEKNPPLVGYALEALMMAFMLDEYNSNAEELKEECETHIPTPFNVDEFYQSQGEGGVSQAKARINQGFGILNHADHANYNAWGVGYYGGSGVMSLSDISSLTNGDEQSVMYSIGCYSAAIEYDCCAERFLNNPSGGGVSYIGNSRYGWYVLGDATQLGGDLDEEFYISLFSRGLYNLGKAHADAKDQWADDASGPSGNPYYKYIILELNLLGDPEMPIWTDSISETDATHLSTIPLGASDFTVTVTETDGTPIEGALVCCMTDDFSVYEKGYTDASGEVTLAVSPVHDGMMWVTASKHNYLPYEGFATVAGDEYTLTVNTVGNGSVDLNPAGGSYPSGTIVTLTANADPSWTFDSWSGDLTGSANPDTITMDGDKTVTATFEEIVVFPDPNLEAAIREAIGKPTGDIYQSDLEGLTSLDASSRNITDLSGLEYCTNLTYLCLDENQINDITQLSGLTSLTTLDLSTNQISDIEPLVNNPGLAAGDIVDLRDNPLDTASVNDYIPQLEARGVTVSWDTTNQLPNQPSNVSPANGATGISLTSTLQSSAFSDPDTSDTHAASQWQITTTPGNYSSPFFDSGIDVSNFTSITIASGALNPNTTYYWHVRHQDNRGDWSSWSAETFFTTIDSDQIGIYRPSKRKFLLDMDGDGLWDPQVDRRTYFGVVGDVPIIGDWNGDGKDQIGIYRPSKRKFLLDMDGDGLWDPQVDRRTYFGVVGDEPIIGDWNGDGKDQIGIYRPDKSVFRLDMDGNGVWNGAVVDKWSRFGSVGDVPITGDWNGDGKDQIGIYRPSNRRFVLDMDGDGLWNPQVDRKTCFGSVGDVPIIGDWNGDGKDQIGIYRPSNRRFVLDMDGDGLWDRQVDRKTCFGSVGDVPIIGDWNGDGKDQIGIYRPSKSIFALDMDGDGLWDPQVDRRTYFGVVGDVPIIGHWGP